MKKFIANKTIQLTEFLLNEYSGKLSYGRLMKLYRERDIKVNGVRVNKNCDVFDGDIIECYYDGAQKALEVIYCDQNVLVCKKPQGITSENYYEQVKNEYPTAIFTHRLDRNTWGIIIYALNEEAYGELFAGFKERTFKKQYCCLVNGSFETQCGVLSDYLIKDEKIGKVYVYNKKVPGSVNIVTEYKTLAKGQKSSILEVDLITGKTHQIRAHLAFYGHFIIGDGKYGVEKINREFKARAQLLVANKLTLRFSQGQKLYYLNEKQFCLEEQKPFEFLK
ncbi:MAG: RluA family pseudouridine synthase [Clostridia bacterium]|nr:RluA family pseudouridine synthase [Clostridia bacterium]